VDYDKDGVVESSDVRIFEISNLIE